MTKTTTKTTTNRITKLVLATSALALALLVGRPDTVQAATTTSNVTVTANVVRACSIKDATLAFGAYDPLSTSDNLATGALSFTCTNGVPITIDLANGSNPAGGLRGMANGANILPYQIYSETTRTTVWGAGAGQNVAATGTGVPVNVTMYGKIPLGKTTVIEGNYQDVVVATLNF